MAAGRENAKKRQALARAIVVSRSPFAPIHPLSRRIRPDAPAGKPSRLQYPSEGLRQGSGGCVWGGPAPSTLAGADPLNSVAQRGQGRRLAARHGSVEGPSGAVGPCSVVSGGARWARLEARRRKLASFLGVGGIF